MIWQDLGSFRISHEIIHQCSMSFKYLRNHTMFIKELMIQNTLLVTSLSNNILSLCYRIRHSIELDKVPPHCATLTCETHSPNSNRKSVGVSMRTELV